MVQDFNVTNCNSSTFLCDDFEKTNDGISETLPAVVPGVYIPRNRSYPQKSVRSKSRRVVSKNGEFNIDRSTHNATGFFSIWFMTMVEARWRWTLLHFFLAFTADWLFFGFIYWIIALVHGDLTEDHLPPNQNASNWVPCVKNIYGFTSTFLFSIEVHTTVAYGRRAITLDCPATITAMCLQCIVCSIFQAFLIGILFTKLTRPKARTQTILFSKQAVVCLRDDKLCMIFRVGDMRKSRILNIKASMFILRLNIEQEFLDDFKQVELDVGIDGCESTFFLWPVSVIHIINETSPLYNVSAADLLCGNIEILVVFEGVIESTGQPVQARSSFTKNDILWGHRFVPMVSDLKKTVYDVDFSKLYETEQVDTPLCSAHEYKSVVNFFDSEINYALDYN